MERNKLKRRLREIGRRQILPLLDRSAAPRDVLLRARGRAYGLTFRELEEDVRAAVEALCSPVS